MCRRERTPLEIGTCIVIGFGPDPSPVIQIPSKRSSTVTDLALVTAQARRFQQSGTTSPSSTS